MSSSEIQKLISEAGEILLGKKEVIQMAMCSCLSQGHILIEDQPGVGKTTLVHLLSKVFGLELKRIQFTNDLLPGDILGTSIFHPQTQEFSFAKGPIFGELILADELNRATPKTQSALLQVMEEGEVNVEGRHFSMPEPFIIMATQNPLEQIGTFPLPESQLDRFFCGLYLDHPAREFEKQILLKLPSISQLKSQSFGVTKEKFLTWCRQVKEVESHERVINYILDLLEFIRKEFSQAGISTRAGQNLLKASQALAYIEGRDYVDPSDVQKVAPSILGHRLGPQVSVKKGHALVYELLKKVPVM